MLAFITAVPIAYILIKVYEWFNKPETGGESFGTGDRLIFKAGANCGKTCIFLDASLIEFTVSMDDGKIIKCQEWEVTHLDNATRSDLAKLA